MNYPKATNVHLGFFDGIRGLLGLGVVLSHALLMAGEVVPAILRAATALDVFMYMSGFFMAYHYRARQEFEPWNKSSTWRSFYVRRFFRVAPLYYVLLTFAYIFQDPLFSALDQIWATFPPPGSNKILQDPTVRDITWLSVLSHYTFLFGLVPRFAANNPLPDWTIGLEAQFYLAFPFLMLLYARLKYVWATLLLVFTWFVAHSLFGVYIASPPGPLGIFPQPTLLFLRIDCFIIGILVAEAFYFRELHSGTALFNLLIALCLAVMGKSIYFSMPILLSILLLFYTHVDNCLRISRPLQAIDRFLSSAFCKFMGDISYSAYLLHLLVIMPVGAYLSLQGWYLSLQPLFRFFTLTGITIPLTYGLAYVTFRIIEQPSVRLGKKIIPKFSHYWARTAKFAGPKAVLEPPGPGSAGPG